MSFFLSVSVCCLSGCLLVCVCAQQYLRERKKKERETKREKKRGRRGGKERERVYVYVCVHAAAQVLGHNFTFNDTQFVLMGFFCDTYAHSTAELMTLPLLL